MPVRIEEAPSPGVDQDCIDGGPAALLPDGTIRRVPGRGHDIALVNDGGTVFAIPDLCLRCSHPLSQGALTGGVLKCAHCGWGYDLARGCVDRLSALKIENYAVTIEGGHVHVHTTPPVRTEDWN